MADFDRPLNKRGEQAAPQMGRFLAEEARLKPDWIVSSPAVRAITTARIVGDKLGYAIGGIVEKPSIYEASTEALLYTVREIESGYQNVILFGHMPGVLEFAHLLIGGQEIDHYPTCGVAQIELDIEQWGDAGPGCGTLRAFLSPKTIG